MSDPLVSIVTPFFNPGVHLAEAVESVLAQTYRPLELLLVDDGSTDGSAETVPTVADPDVAVRRARLAKNSGPAVARNLGVRDAHGQFVTFLDADDLMLPGRLRFQVDYLTQHPAVAVVTGAAEYFIEPGVDSPPWLMQSSQAIRTEYRNPMTMMVRRDVFDRVGAFEPAYHPSDDTAWLLRSAVAGVGIAHVDRPLIRRRIHDRNLTRRTSEFRQALERLVLDLARARITARRCGP